MMLRITAITTSLYGINLLHFVKEFVLCEVRTELYEYRIINSLKSHDCATVGMFVCLMRLVAGQVPHSPFCFWVQINIVICAKYRLYFSLETSRIICI